MPKNKVIYVGILIVAAAALLWAGGQIISRIDWFLPWAGGFGALLIVVGIALEARKKSAAATVDPEKAP